MNSTYSVIIPHYNSPTLLQRCLASIPDCEDIQVIVVDDCSDPKIVDFDTLPGRERLFTEIYRTPQGGSAGRARNVGLEHAKGKWLLFADADDFFTTNAFNTFKQHCDDDTDIIFFGIESRDSDTLEQANRCQFIQDLVVDYTQSPSNLTETNIRLKHVVPWGKMIRRTFVEAHNVRFDEIKYSNDVMFSVQTGLLASNVHVNSQTCYCVTFRDNSLTAAMSKEALMTRLEVCMRRNKLFRDTQHSNYQISLAYYLRIAFKFGLGTVIDVLRMGKKYNANFLIGISHWHKTLINMILHKQQNTNPWQK